MAACLVTPGLAITSENPGTSRADVVEAGVDTWRLVFQAFLGGPNEQGGWHVPGSVFKVGDNYRGQYFGEYNVLAVEGHPRPGELCPSDGLDQAYADVIAELDENEIRPTGFRGVSRLDVTCTQRFVSPAEGRAVLVGLAALDVPGCKQVVYGKPVETVGIISNRGRRLLGRVYDKGIEAGWVDDGRDILKEWSAQRGEFLRLEEQGRFGSQRRPGREHLMDAGYLKTRFERRFAPLWQASKGVKVAGLPVIAEELRTRVESGEMTIRAAERAGGFLLLEMAGVSGSLAQATRYRRKRELRELGLVLADEFYEPVQVHLAEVLERALETPRWG
jgi:hypothetical protein